MPSPSAGRIGRTWATVPSRRTTSASHSTGYPGGSGSSSMGPSCHPAASAAPASGHTGPGGASRRRPAPPHGAPLRPRRSRCRPRSSATSSRWPCAHRAPGSARAGTSSPCSTRPTGPPSGRRPTTAPPRTPGAAGSSAAPALVLCLSRPRRLPRPLRRAGQGLDRPVDRPVAGPLLGHRHRHGGDGACCSAPRTPAWARCSSACPVERHDAVREAFGIPDGRRLVGVVALGTRPSGCRARRAPAGAGRSTRCCTSGGSACREGQRHAVCEDGADPRRGTAATLIDPEPSPTPWPSAAAPLPPRTSPSGSSTSTSRRRCAAPSSSTPTASSTRAPCPTPATASSPCSAASCSG